MPSKYKNLPDKTQCLKIHKKYKTPKNVIQHCLAVAEIAEEICTNLADINSDLVVAGAMLHDIGRSKTHSIHHATEGAKILKKENINPKIINIVKKHIGTGITLNEAVKLGLPPDDYIPKTLEEIVVSYADNLLINGERRSFQDVLEQFSRKFGSDSPIVKGWYRQKEIIERNNKDNKGIR